MKQREKNVLNKMSVYTKAVTFYDHVPPYLINLSMGAPSKALLQSCSEILKRAAAHRMDQDDAYTLFQYGPEIGTRQYRESVAKLLTEEYQSPVNVEDVMGTAGATQGFHLISHLLFSPGDVAFVENPTYFMASTLFKEDAGMVLKGVPMDDLGVIPEGLEKVIEANKNYRPRELTKTKPYWGILYILSTFQNPRGMNLPPDRCRRVVELARKYKLLVVSDDVYNLLYHDKPPNRLFAYDNKSDPDYFGNVVSNGSFSKIFGPGIRLGWLEAPKHVSNTILSSAFAASGGSFNHTASGIMSSIINLGLLQDMLKKSRPVYHEQCKALCEALRAKIPSAQFIQPHGGYFVWVKLPDGLDGKELLHLCKVKYGLMFSLGEVMSIDGSFKNHIRLSFSRYDKETLTGAVSRLAQAVRELTGWSKL